MTRAIVFDAVGTLIYPEPDVAQVYAQAGRRYGSRLTPAEIGPRFRQAFREHERDELGGSLETSEEFERARWRRIVACVLDDVTDSEACYAELFAHFARPTAWRVYSDVPAVLAQVASRGLSLGIASNFDDRLLKLAPQLAPLDPCQFVLVSSQIGFRKPHRKFFETILDWVKLPADQVLYVGDDPNNDLDGARAAGMQAALIDRNGLDHPQGIRSLAELDC